MGKIILVLGILGILLGIVIALVSLLLPSMTSNISMSEASIGIIAGAAVLVISFVPAIIGIIIMVAKRKS